MVTNYFSLNSLRGVADIHLIHVVVVLLMACFTLRTASEDGLEADARTVHVPTSERIVPTSADNKTTNNSGYSWGPIISSVSNDTTLNIYNDHGKVHLICEASGENISGGYWVRVNGNHLSPIHNKSKMSYYNDGKAIRLQLTIMAAHPSHSGRYRCIVYSQWGVVKSKKVKVAIKFAPPEIIHQPSNRSIVALHNATFICKASGYKIRYHWRSHNNHTIIGTGSALSIIRATPLDRGQYYCVAYSKGGLAFSNNATLEINDNINLIIEPSKLVVAEGETINIEIKAEGPGKENFTYQWRRDNASLTSTAIGENTPSITITSATLSDGGSYYCVVKNEWGRMVESNRSIMNIISVLLKPDHQTEATGQTIELTCEVYGTSLDDLTYQWIIPGQVKVNGSYALTISNATVNDSGIYFCIVHTIDSSNDGIKSNIANVSILGLPRIIVHPSSITIVEGSSVVLMCKATGEGTLNYQWKRVSGSLPKGALGYNDTNLRIFNATINYSGQYYCKVDNGGASVNSMKSNVIVKGKPIITSVSRSQIYTVTDDDEIIELVCKITGNNITLAYFERLNGTLSNVTNHTIINANSNEVILNMSFKAYPHNSGDFQCIAYGQWGVTRSTIASVSIVAAPPTFTVHPTDEVAIALENVTFKAEAKGFRVKFEWLFYNSSGTYPLGTEITNKSSSTLTLYRVTPSNAGHYFCIAKTHGKNRVFSRNVTLTVNDSFTVKLNSEYIVGINGSVVMNVVSKGPGSAYYKYKWEKVDNDSLPSTASGQDTPNLIINKVKMTDNGSYVCHVRNNWGTTVTSNVASILVLSVELQPLSMSVPALGFVNYTCQSSITSSVKYQWIHNDTLMRNESSAVLNITNISWNETGIYHCMVTAINNVSVESNGGFLNMTSKSVQPLTNENSITATTIALICVFSVLATVIFLVLVGCSVCCLYRKCRTNKLSLSQVEGVASVVEMTNQTGQSATAATRVTVTTTLNNSNSSINTNGNDSGNNSDNGDSDNDNGDNIDDGSGDNNDNINGNINNDSDSNNNGDNNDTGNIINDNGSNDDDIGDNNDSGNNDKDGGSNDNENNNDNNSDDNDNDNKDNYNGNDDSMSSSNNCNNTSISSSNSSACIKKQTGQIQVVCTDGTRNILDIIREMNPELNELINITELLQYLIKYRIPTDDEEEHLSPVFKSTRRQKIQFLLSMLSSKGKTGHENFVRAIYESSKKRGNSGHCQIIKRFKKEGISIDELEE